MIELDSTIINRLEEKIKEIYKVEHLENIAGLDQSYTINDKQVLAWHGQIATKSKTVNPNFNFMQSFDDCASCSDAIMYFTGHTYLYRPYITSPSEHPVSVKGKTFYPHSPNVANKRYHMYVNIVFEKLYNYWDKIGDFIAAHFPDDITPERVFFSNALDIAKKYFPESVPLGWLTSFRDNDYKAINNMRKKAVHYSGTDVEFRWQHIQNFTDKVTLVKYEQELLALPETFKLQMSNVRQGFYKCLEFLEEFHHVKDSDIDKTTLAMESETRHP